MFATKKKKKDIKSDKKVDQQNEKDNQKQKEVNELKQMQHQNKMKSGEYGIHIYVQETRDLLDSDNPTGAVDPIIKIQAFGEDQYSEVKSGVGSEMAYWGTHFFFQKNFETDYELKIEQIKIKVYDHAYLLSDTLIGSTSLSVPTIYRANNHCYLHKWLGLVNYKGGYQQHLRGFMKLSINIYGDGDDQVELKNQQLGGKSSDNFDKNNIMMPVQLVQKPYQMVISIIQCQHLPNMDTGLGIDPFIQIDFSSQSIKTDVVYKNNNPIYGLKIKIPFTSPSFASFMKLTVYDYDLLSASDIVGSTIFMKDKIMKHEYKRFYWMNLYGSNVNGSTTYAELMNSQSDLGSWWKGRVLMKVDCKETENPQICIENIKDKTVQYFTRSQQAVNYQINVELLFGMNFPYGSRYSVKIRWAECQVMFGATTMFGSRNGIYEIFQKQLVRCTFPYQSSEELPDLFIYLVDISGNHVSYIRIPAHEVMNNLLSPPSIQYFRVDKSINQDIQDNEAGMIKYRLAIGSESQMQDQSIGGWDHQQVSNIKGYKYLVVNIFQARQLIQGDSDGSDSYVRVQCYGEVQKTKEISKNCNPIWYERKILKIPYFEDSIIPPILIQVFDKDLLADDFIGGTIIEDIKENQEEDNFGWNTLDFNLKPKWYDLYYNKQNYSGSVLLSFNYVDSIDTNVQLRELDIAKTEYHIKLKVLGLRGLIPSGMLNINKPFITFDLNSMLDEKSKFNLKEQHLLRTVPEDDGRNPNIMNIIEFTIRLPVDFNYFPFLSCDVNDYAFLGYYRPLLGNFTINFIENIKLYYSRMNRKIKKIEERKERIKQLQKSQTAGAILNKDVKIDIPDNQGDLSINKPIQNNNSEENKLIENKYDDDDDENVVDDDDDESQNKKEIKNINVNQNDQKDEDEDDQKLNSVENEKIKQKSRKSIKDKMNGGLDKLKGGFKDIKNIFEPFSGTKEVVAGMQQDNEYKVEILRNEQEVMDFKNNRIRRDKIQVKAIYEYTQGEYSEKVRPNPDHYMEVGYDSKKDKRDKKTQKHYRFYVNDELENTMFINKVFDDIKIYRTDMLSIKNFLLNPYKSESSSQEVGIFKGKIEIINKIQENMMKEKYSDALEVIAKKESEFNKILTQTSDVLIRVYILKVTNIQNLKGGDKCDSYLKLQLGDQVFHNRENYQEDADNPKFYECFEIKSFLPGPSQLKIQLIDYNYFLSDKMIGQTVIDLENRYFCKRWTNSEQKPIEVRDIKHPSSKLSKGRIYMFLDIFKLNKKSQIPKQLSIANMPRKLFEIRVIVWECSGVPSQDIEDCSDLYVIAKLADQEQQTDIHFRAMGGQGSFNYRLIFNFMFPMEDYTATFQIWDKDLLSGDDFVSSTQFNFRSWAEFAYQNDTTVKISGQPTSREKKPDKFTRDLIARDEKSKKLKKQSKIMLQFEIVPQEIADNNKVGKAQQVPNHSPYLPPTVGRLSFSKGLFGLLNQLVGPKIKRACCCLICICCCCNLLLIMIPVIFGDLVSYYITHYSGIKLKSD